ncbi:hypothetical protein [Natrinema sp. DC36]|uniref:hypothetical protein n=1 Tax=Natrinema sp. DC36 TaxID=2878680 RepID=UPI001CF0388B|nr:hypothetical protein [Natrinema sp. DC36]
MSQESSTGPKWLSSFFGPDGGVEEFVKALFYITIGAALMAMVLHEPTSTNEIAESVSCYESNC